VNGCNVQLKPGEFARISQLVQELSGICLTAGKEELVRSRLMKRLRALGLGSFDAYLRYLKEDRTAEEKNVLIDSLTTNKTSFFREGQHFEYLRTRIIPALQAQRESLRLWSAGCSSGEEPYSLAMLLFEEWPGCADPKILATDICNRVLDKARSGEYDREAFSDIPAPLVEKYFVPIPFGASGVYRVSDRLKRVVRFARLNLMDPWPMKGPFDAIFCRNVLMYFDHSTQRELVRRFHDLLATGGHLLIGYSESLMAFSSGFQYVQPGTYLKP
jgi:chemotaxis protein methyltransferase CheR